MTEVARRHIGFDRKIELAWLDAVAAQAVVGATGKEARQYVWRLLDGVIAGDTIHDARGKTLTVLSKIWLSVPEHARELRDEAIKLFSENPLTNNLPLHWALMIAVYPFFLDVAASIGKLTAMNGEVTLSQIVRRMRDAWGDRSTLPRATQRILRSMVQWGVLRDGNTRGRYLPVSAKITVDSPRSELLLVGMLIGIGRSTALMPNLVYPSLFPFQVMTTEIRLQSNPHLQFYRQSDQRDHFAIRV